MGNDCQAKADTEELFKNIEDWDEQYDKLAWCYTYKGDYKKAYEMYEAHEDNKELLASPTGYAEYCFLAECIKLNDERT